MPSCFETKPRLAAGICKKAADWHVPQAPVLGDAAYGDDAGFRSGLEEAGLDYVLSVKPETTVFGPGTGFAVPSGPGRAGRRPHTSEPDRKAESVRALAQDLPADAWQTLPCRTTPAGVEIASRFAFVHVVAAHPVQRDRKAPRWEWLIVEWPDGEQSPTDYWLSNLPETESHERLARLARLRWMIELDYRELKGELGLDHYEGRSTGLPPPHRPGHLRSRVPHPGAPRPESPAAGLTLPQAVLLMQPVIAVGTAAAEPATSPSNLEQLELFTKRE